VSDFSPGPGGSFPAGFEPGSVIAGYRLEKKIGSGGMALVFLARDKRLHRWVALKVLPPALTWDESVRERFIQESQAAAAVDDPHIIPVYDAGEVQGVLFIAMRYVAGGDVRGLLARERQIPAARVAAIVSAVASALDAAHAAGLVHRDVKPANILLDTRPGRADHVYLSDFGLSKGAFAVPLVHTRSGQFVGTPDYTAPEQIQGHPVTGRTDQYGLACTAFELLCGEPVYPRGLAVAIVHAHLSEPPPALSSRRPGLPAAADAVLARALAKAPAERYASCAEFAAALRRALGLPVAESVPPPAAVTAAPATPAAVPAGLVPASPGPVSPGPASPAGIIPAPAAPAATPPVPVTAAPVTVTASPATDQGPAPSPSAPVTQPGRAAAVQAGATGPLPPGRLVSRRGLLVAGLAAVPVVAGAGAVAVVALRGSGSGARQSGRAGASGHEPRWQTQVPSVARPILSAAGDLVVIAGQGGYPVRALSASNGQVKWISTMHGGTILGMEAHPEAVYVGLDLHAPKAFTALRPSDGSSLWTSPFGSYYGLATTPGSVYLGTTALEALSSSDGSQRWDVKTLVMSNPVTHGGSLYVLTAEHPRPPSVLRAFSTADGSPLWQSPGPFSGIIETDGSVICAFSIPATSQPGRLWAWRASDGKLLWKSPGHQTFGPPAVLNGVIYAVRDDGTMIAFRPADRAELWSRPVDAQIVPATSKSVIYAGDPSGGLIALRAADGQPLWKAGSRFTAGPVVAAGSVYVTDGSSVTAIPI
jgi:outer membrane protein assembly factor BamB